MPNLIALFLICRQPSNPNFYLTSPKYLPISGTKFVKNHFLVSWNKEYHIKEIQSIILLVIEHFSLFVSTLFSQEKDPSGLMFTTLFSSLAFSAANTSRWLLSVSSGPVAICFVSLWRQMHGWSLQ